MSPKDANKHEKATIVIPAYNEEQAIGGVLEALLERYPQYEILVVNDGSADNTKEIAESYPCRVISHPVNRGYGASWKTGVLNASNETVVFFDSDGQFDPNDISRLLTELRQSNADMAVGARGVGSHVPFSRRPGKMVLNILASFLAREHIPDPNCGLRAVRKELLERYLHLLPDGFSASLTSLLLFYKRRYRVRFVPITVKKRLGQSSVNIIRDGFGTIMLMTRLIALFDPLRIFLPASGMLLSVAFIYSVVEALINGLGVPVLGAVLSIGGLLCFFLGIVCDQISALRLEGHNMQQVSRIERIRPLNAVEERERAVR